MVEILVNRMIDNKKAAANKRLAKKRVQCLIEALCFVSSSVMAESLVLRNPLLRQAPKRQAVKKPFFFYNFLYQNAYIFTLCQANFEFILVGSRNNRG